MGSTDAFGLLPSVRNRRVRREGEEDSGAVCVEDGRDDHESCDIYQGSAQGGEE